MRIWRLIRQEYAPDLEGEGARLHGGRWNSRGVPVVYCSSSLALALLETFVHLPHELRQSGNFPRLIAFGLDVPDDSLEHGFVTNTVKKTAFLGDSFVAMRQCLGLLVPSRVVPQDRNILLNPHHPRMTEVKIVIREPFIFDDRSGG